MMVWKVVIERVTVIQFRMDNGGDIRNMILGTVIGTCCVEP